jgi:hypothetical protein
MAQTRACRLQLLDRQQSMGGSGSRADQPHEARHCAISYFIAAGLDWKQISTWAGRGDVRQTWNRYGHLVSGGEDTARERLDAFLTPTQPTPTVAHKPNNDETPERHGDYKVPLPGFEPGFPP